MELHTRRALSVAALFAIAGCSGAAGPSGSPVAPAGSSAARSGTAVVQRGVPFVPFARPTRGRASRLPRPTRERNRSSSHRTKKSRPSISIRPRSWRPILPRSQPSTCRHGCPYGLLVDKMGTIYVADNCGGNDVEEYAKGSTTMTTSITNGISNPLGLAIDKAARCT